MTLPTQQTQPIDLWPRGKRVEPGNMEQGIMDPTTNCQPSLDH